MEKLTMGGAAEPCCSYADCFFGDGVYHRVRVKVGQKREQVTKRATLWHTIATSQP
jgi:hypothetical protein